MSVDQDDLEIGLAGFDDMLRFPHRAVTLLKGGAGSGKSTFAYCAIASLQRFSTEPIPVVFIDTEGGFSKARLADVVAGYGCMAEPDVKRIEVTTWDELKSNVSVVSSCDSPRIAVLDSLGVLFRQEYMEKVEANGAKLSQRAAGAVVRDMTRILLDMRKTVERTHGYGFVTNWLRSTFSTDGEASGKPPKTDGAERWDFLCGSTLAYLAKAIYDLEYHPWGMGTLTVDKHKYAPRDTRVHYRFTGAGVEHVPDAAFDSARAEWSRDRSKERQR